MTAVLDDYLTLDALAAEFGVDIRTIRRWCYSSSPGLAVTKVGRSPLVHRDDLAAWMKAHRTVRNPTAVHRRGR